MSDNINDALKRIQRRIEGVFEGASERTRVVIAMVGAAAIAAGVAAPDKKDLKEYTVSGIQQLTKAVDPLWKPDHKTDISNLSKFIGDDFEPMMVENPYEEKDSLLLQISGNGSAARAVYTADSFRSIVSGEVGTETHRAIVYFDPTDADVINYYSGSKHSSELLNKFTLLHEFAHVYGDGLPYFDRDDEVASDLSALMYLRKEMGQNEWLQFAASLAVFRASYGVENDDKAHLTVPYIRALIEVEMQNEGFCAGFSHHQIVPFATLVSESSMAVQAVKEYQTLNGISAVELGEWDENALKETFLLNQDVQAVMSTIPGEQLKKELLDNQPRQRVNLGRLEEVRLNGEQGLSNHVESLSND